jgi:hypothetical protein
VEVKIKHVKEITEPAFILGSMDCLVPSKNKEPGGWRFFGI